MKYLFIFFIALPAYQCSPKLAPDAGWGFQRWVLVEMKGVPVQQSGGRRDAFLQFRVAERRFEGNGGCNQIHGVYTIDDNTINFGEIGSTKMMCEDIDFENTFLQLLDEVNRYETNGSDILLKKKRETVLVFRAK